jgi:hypothetical protein
MRCVVPDSEDVDAVVVPAAVAVGNSDFHCKILHGDSQRTVVLHLRNSEAVEILEAKSGRDRQGKMESCSCCSSPNVVLLARLSCFRPFLLELKKKLTVIRANLPGKLKN